MRACGRGADGMCMVGEGPRPPSNLTTLPSLKPLHVTPYQTILIIAMSLACEGGMGSLGLGIGDPEWR